MRRRVLWSALAVVGHHFLWTHLVGLVRVRWRPVLISYGFTLVLVAWIVGGHAVRRYETTEVNAQPLVVVDGVATNRILDG